VEVGIDMDKTILTQAPYIISCLLYIPEMTLSYFLMLAAMSFNTSIFISLVAGLSVGNCAFSWMGIKSGNRKVAHH